MFYIKQKKKTVSRQQRVEVKVLNLLIVLVVFQQIKNAYLVVKFKYI